MDLKVLNEGLNEVNPGLKKSKNAKSTQASLNQKDTTSFYSYLLKNKKTLTPKKVEKINSALNAFKDSKIDDLKEFLAENIANIDQYKSNSFDDNKQLNNFNQLLIQKFPELKNLDIKQDINNSKNYDYIISGNPSENSKFSIDDIKQIIGIASESAKILKNTISISDISNLLSGKDENFIHSPQLNPDYELTKWMGNDEIQNLMNKMFDSENNLKTGDLDTKFRSELTKMFGIKFTDELSLNKIEIKKEQLNSNVIDISSFTDDISKQIRELLLQSPEGETLVPKSKENFKEMSFEDFLNIKTNNKIIGDIKEFSKISNGEFVDSDFTNKSKENNFIKDDKISNFRDLGEFKRTKTSINENSKEYSKSIVFDEQKSIIKDNSLNSGNQLKTNTENSKTFIKEVLINNSSNNAKKVENKDSNNGIRFNEKNIISERNTNSKSAAISLESKDISNDSNKSINSEKNNIARVSSVNSEKTKVTDKTNISDNPKIGNQIQSVLSADKTIRNEKSEKFANANNSSNLTNKTENGNSFKEISLNKDNQTELKLDKQMKSAMNTERSFRNEKSEKIVNSIKNIGETKTDNLTEKVISKEKSVRAESKETNSNSGNKGNFEIKSENQIKDKKVNINPEELIQNNIIKDSGYSNVNILKSPEQIEFVLENRIKLTEIKDSVKLMFNNIAGEGNYSANIRLSPKELGNINIQILIQNDSASIKMKADNNDTLDLMQNQVDELIGNLKDKGIKVESFEINLNRDSDYTENFEKNNQQNQKKHKEELQTKQSFINSFRQNLNSANL